MGYRAHACKKYEVAYGEGLLNWKCDFISNLFSEYCPSFNSQGEEFLEMEVKFEELKGLIRTLQSMSDDEFCNLLKTKEQRNEIYRAYVISALISLYNDGDKRNEYLHIHWF